MPTRTVHAREVSAAELEAWIIHDDPDLLVIDKPAGVVCHPSKTTPISSLAGAVRVHRGLEHPHLVSRLDRETSGLVVLAKTDAMARRLQMAISRRLIGKTYLAIVHGRVAAEIPVDQPLGDDTGGPVAIRTRVRPDGKAALTRFTPLASSDAFSLVRAVPETGRKHQIRAHAQWMGHPLVGDKLYGSDPRLYLEFVEGGWTAGLAEKLLLPHHALHCLELDLTGAGVPCRFHAPFPPGLQAFCAAHGIDWRSCFPCRTGPGL